MAKAELWKVKALGRLIDMLGTFPVNRGEADRTAVKRALEMLAAGAVVGMFPEGHRQRSGAAGGDPAGRVAVRAARGRGDRPDGSGRHRTGGAQRACCASHGSR